MRRFHLIRSEDVSGVSGTGTVAEGIQFTDGTVILRWMAKAGKYPATTQFRYLMDMEAVHGHDGRTVVKWVDYIDVL